MEDARPVHLFLVVGHNSSAKGAMNPRHPELNEFDINSKIAEKVSEILTDKGMVNTIIKGGGVMAKVQSINNQVDHNNMNVLVSLHFNAYKGYISNSSGSEVLISDKRPESAPIAECLLSEFESLTECNRGIKIVAEGGRGNAILRETDVDYAVLCEPLFIDAEEGENLLDEGVIDFLVNCYVNGIVEGLKCIFKKQLQ